LYASDIVWPRAAMQIWRCASSEHVTQSPKLPFAFAMKSRTLQSRLLSKNASMHDLTYSASGDFSVSIVLNFPLPL